MTKLKRITSRQCLFVGLIALLGACSSDTPAITATVPEGNKDEQQLLALVKKLYQWHTADPNPTDFEPIADAKDSLYIGIDRIKHLNRVEILQKTGFFNDEFIAGYNKISGAIDQGLKDTSLIWAVGDLPTFGNESDPWCLCQDEPENDFWQNITLQNLEIKDDKATFQWVWNNTLKYKVKAVRENDTWRISELEGFVFETYMGK